MCTVFLLLIIIIDILLTITDGQWQTIWSDNMNSNNGWSCSNSYCDFGYSTSRCPNSGSDCNKLAGGWTYAIRTTPIWGYSAMRFQFDVEVNSVESGEWCAVYSRYDGSGGWYRMWDEDNDKTYQDLSFDLPSPSGRSSIEIKIEVDGDGDGGKTDRCYFDNGVLEGYYNPPTPQPTNKPTVKPTVKPTTKPTSSPTDKPTPSPTNNPTPSPTSYPTPAPTINPTPAPTENPTAFGSPTTSPTNPTRGPTNNPTPSPTDIPTATPTPAPTDDPTPSPTDNPIISPTNRPSKLPTNSPTNIPTVSPTKSPSESVESTEAETMEKENNSFFALDNVALLALLALICILICCLILVIIWYCRRRTKRNHLMIHIKKVELEPIPIASTSPSSNTNINTNANTYHKSAESGPGFVTLESWLSNIGLIQYYDIFVENGFVDSKNSKIWITDLNNSDLKDMGISKVAHRKLILHQIEADKEKNDENEKDGDNEYKQQYDYGDNVVIRKNTVDIEGEGDGMAQIMPIVQLQTNGAPNNRGSFSSDKSEYDQYGITTGGYTEDENANVVTIQIQNKIERLSSVENEDDIYWDRNEPPLPNEH